MLELIMIRCPLRFWRDESGQDLVEYSLLGVLIAVACVAGMNTVAGSIKAAFGSMTAAL